jgi:hypothetical protein
LTKHEMGTETAEDENKRTTNEGEKFTKERLGPLKGMSSWVSEAERGTSRGATAGYSWKG